MNKNPKIYIDHIIQSIDLLEEYLTNIAQTEFDSSIKLQDLTCRRLEIIGEAVKNIPEEFKTRYSDIRWKNIAGLRDILIHQYFGIDMQLLWNVVKRDIPELKLKIKGIVIKENW